MFFEIVKNETYTLMPIQDQVQDTFMVMVKDLHLMNGRNGTFGISNNSIHRTTLSPLPAEEIITAWDTVGKNENVVKVSFKFLNGVSLHHVQIELYLKSKPCRSN